MPPHGPRAPADHQSNRQPRLSPSRQYASFSVPPYATGTGCRVRYDGSTYHGPANPHRAAATDDEALVSGCTLIDAHTTRAPIVYMTAGGETTVVLVVTSRRDVEAGE